jgi:hypothetical protein
MADISDHIIAAEWLMFNQVQNMGGRAPCQDDLRGFAIMRKSQFYAWDAAMLKSYAHDLSLAEASGRNLLAEKYAYMMKYSAPADYAAIAHLLPSLDETKKMMVDEIVRASVSWQMEVARHYPKAMRRGRAISNRANSGEVSFEDYLRGELCTYSENTLRAYLQRVHECQRQGINMNLLILAQTARLNGFRSLEEAESRLP